MVSQQVRFAQEQNSMKKKSLFRQSVIRLAILGVILILGVCAAAGWQFYKQNMQFYTELAYSFVRLGTMNVDGDKVNKIIENRDFFEEFFKDRDNNLFFDPELNEKDQIEDPELKEIMKYWFDIEGFVTSTSYLHEDIVYFYIVIPGEDNLIYLWDSDHNYDIFTKPFEQDKYTTGEKENLLRTYTDLWSEKLVTYKETMMTLGTAMSPIYDSEGNVVAVAALDISITEVRNGFWHLMVNIVFIVALLMLIAGAIYFAIFRRRVIVPIETLESAASGMVENLKSDDHQPVKVDVHSDDEIGALARSFENMGSSLRDYIDENARISAEKERIGTELSLASNIQNGMLSRDFLSAPEFEIYASMDPAKEVGGDFYDFFLRDEDHLALVMADVSGKGVPGALFMMVTMILAKDYIKEGISPAEVLGKINAVICSNNNNSMFVTMWIGILDLKSGNLVASNAGHEYPVIRTSGGKFEMFKDKHGFVVGGMEESVFHDYEVELKPGSDLFLYTDGLPEAENESAEMFGPDRMLEALNSDPSASPDKIIENVNAAVADYVKDAPQFDDLTMMCIEYKGSNHEI